ncbi:MAG: winged helix-turn-helix domain-containing protein, partial [Verrucomicrobia bacterium]|nr:winged helix-turn-helix domain-containing protein [Verrucomicrobiota bacterium]
NKSVRRDDHTIQLTPREYALLEYLALRSGETVTRTEIWDHVYEDSTGGSSNNVDVYIGYLRKKLGDNDGEPLIQTVRGYGYRLGPPSE